MIFKNLKLELIYIVDLHRNNVSGSAATVQRALDNDHRENMEMIRNKNDYDRQREGNRHSERNKELDIEFEDHKEKNRRDLIKTQGQVNIDTIKVQGEVNEKIKILENERKKDQDIYNLNVKKEDYKHDENLKKIENEQEIKRIEANILAKKTEKELEI